MISRSLPLNFVNVYGWKTVVMRKEGFSREVISELEATFMEKDLPPVYKEFSPIFMPPFYYTMDYLVENISSLEIIHFFFHPKTKTRFQFSFHIYQIRESLCLVHTPHVFHTSTCFGTLGE